MQRENYDIDISLNFENNWWGQNRESGLWTGNMEETSSGIVLAYALPTLFNGISKIWCDYYLLYIGLLYYNMIALDRISAVSVKDVLAVEEWQSNSPLADRTCTCILLVCQRRIVLPNSNSLWSMLN